MPPRIEVAGAGESGASSHPIRPAYGAQASGRRILPRMSPLRLRALREAAELSQEALATRVGARQATISDLERGKARRIDLALIDRLAAALGVEPGELFERRPAAKKGKRG